MIVDFINIIMDGLILVTVIYAGRCIVAAIDSLNQNILDLNATIAAISLPANQDAAIQSAADAVAASNVALKAKTGQ